MNATKEVSSVKFLQVNANAYRFDKAFNNDNKSNVAFSDLKYNALNNVVEGKFTAILYYSIYIGVISKQSVDTISNGSFSCKVVQKISNTRKSN